MRKSRIFQAFSLCTEELFDIFHNPKLYIVLLCVFFFLNREFKYELNELLLYQKTPSFWEIWPYASCNYKKMLVIWCGYFIMISELPTQGERLTSFIIRTQKWVYALSQQLFIFIFSIFYFLFLQLSIVIIFSAKVSLYNTWTAYTKYVLIQSYGQAARISFRTTPIQMFIFSAVLFLIILFFIGMLILDFNLYTKRIIGYIIAILLIIFDITLQIVDFPQLNWFSPVTLTRLTGINLGYTYELPTFWYSLAVIVVLLILLTTWLYAALKTYDFHKGGNS